MTSENYTHSAFQPRLHAPEECRRSVAFTRRMPLNLPSMWPNSLEDGAVSRDSEPVPSQWYENLEEEEQFRVLSVDEDSELIEIEYLDGDIEEIDLETWHEMALEKIQEPEGWSESDDEDEADDEDWDEEA